MQKLTGFSAGKQATGFLGLPGASMQKTQSVTARAGLLILVAPIDNWSLLNHIEGITTGALCWKVLHEVLAYWYI